MEFIACTGAGKVIGRYKASDIEMTDDVKPANSHSALANVGDDFKVVRDNMPFRTSSETGTYFIAYASTFSTVQKCWKVCLLVIRRQL